MLFNEVRNVLGLKLLVKNTFGLDQHNRSDSAEAVAAGFNNFDFIRKLSAFQLFLKGFLKDAAIASLTACATAQHQLSSYLIHAGLLHSKIDYFRLVIDYSMDNV